MSFVIRIELNDSTLSDFTILHQAMSSMGFSQKISSDDGKEYHLPRATYLGKTSSHTKSQILELAKKAVAQTGKTSEIFVAEYSGATWVGLKPVK